MPSRIREDPRIETLLYVLVLTIGVSLIVLSYYQEVSFRQDLMMGLGTNMMVVTLVFLIFKLFGKSQACNASAVVSTLDELAAEIGATRKEMAGIRLDMLHVNQATTDRVLDTQEKMLMQFTSFTLSNFPPNQGNLQTHD